MDVVDFEVGEVVELKGLFFKICLVDGFTGKVGLKQISPEEAKCLDEMNSTTKT
ncbi:MAG: hypothetical protein ACI9CF_001360 [Candidatus Omnitrophota bacterium]|jgi:hypothetical protein